MKYLLSIIFIALIQCGVKVMNENNDNGTYVPFKDLKLRKTPSLNPVIWGAKVSPDFRYALHGMCGRLQHNADNHMAVYAFEGNKEFSPATKNIAGSGATGFIQCMPDTARYNSEIWSYALRNCPPKELEKLTLPEQMNRAMKTISEMTPIEYLDHVVEPYFRPYTGKLFTIEDTYMAVLKPEAIGWPNNYVLFRREEFLKENEKKLPKEKQDRIVRLRLLEYRQNIGLDFNKDGFITKGEASARVKEMFEEGKKYIK